MTRIRDFIRLLLDFVVETDTNQAGIYKSEAVILHGFPSMC